MLTKLLVILVFLNLYLSHNVQEIPIPTTYDGFTVYGKQVLSVNSLTLEAFYDLLCPDCNASYPIVMQAISTLQLNLKQNFTFVVHVFPLPYHRYSFIASQGEKYLKQKLGDESLQTYMELMFANQQSFWNAKEYNVTEDAIKQQLATLVANKFTQINATQMVQALNNSTLSDLAHNSWQYGCTRGVSGTPTYFANGVEVTNGDVYDLEDWTGFLQSFYSASVEQ